MIKLQNISIRQALIATICLALVLTTILSTLFTSIQFKNVFDEFNEYEYFPNVLGKVEGRIRAELNTPFALAQGMKQNTFMTDWILAEEPASGWPKMQQYFTHLKSQNDAAVVFWVSDVSNQYYKDDGIFKTMSRSNPGDAWFYNFLSSPAQHQMAIDVDEGTRKLTAFVNVKVTGNNKPLGVTGLGYDISEIANIVNKNRVGQSGYVFLLTDAGEVAAHPNANTVGKLFSDVNKYSGLKSIVDDSKNTQDGYVIRSVELDGEAHYVATYTIATMNWTLVALLPTAELNSVINGAVAKTVIANIIIAIVFITLMIWMANRISRSIAAISVRLMEMGAKGGDLTHRLDDSREDELGDLAKGFNAIIAKTQSMVMEIIQIENTLSRALAQLLDSFEEVANLAAQQDGLSEQVASAITEMGTTVEEVSKLALDTAHSSDNTSQQTQDSLAATTHSAQAMSGLTDVMGSAYQNIQDLAHQAEAINSIVDVINAISEQTNLLALNAAIEAARAGEQGRGFAVVADEVRTLASRTQSSTQEIKSQIEQFQKSTEQALTAMAKGNETTSEVNQTASKSAEFLQDINDNISSVKDMNQQIATATEQQNVVVQHINESAVQIADLSHKFHDIAVEDKSQLSELKKLTDQLSVLVGQFKV